LTVAINQTTSPALALAINILNPDWFARPARSVRVSLDDLGSEQGLKSGPRQPGDCSGDGGIDLHRGGSAQMPGGLGNLAGLPRRYPTGED
jgi:hypothetical protein